MSYTKIIIKKNVRIFVSDYTEIAQSAIQIQSQYPLPSLILAKAIAILGPLSFLGQKNNGKTIATIKSEGPIKLLVVESRNNGDIRALIANDQIETEYDEEDFNTIPLILGIGQTGTLRIVHQYNGQQFGGEVILANCDLITDLAYYFDLSEQIKTAIRDAVFFSSKNKIERAYSAIFQLLPDHTEKDIIWIENFIKKYDLNQMSVDDYIAKIDGTILKTNSAQWKCSCSETHSLQIAKLLDKSEIAAILKQHGKIEVFCHFCKTKYCFTEIHFQ